MTTDYTSPDSHLLSSISGAILNITLNRPEKRNALTYQMYESLAQLLKAAEANSDIRVVVLTGTGQYFTSGSDVRSFATGTDLAYDDKPSFRFMNTLARFRKPIIAAVNGNAVGIGVTMLLHCDLVYASSGSSFRMPFLSLGLIPEFASTLLLPASIGHAKAAELLMIGDTFNSEQAESLGIVSGVAAQNGLMELVRDRALNLASKPREAVLTTKRLMKKHAREMVMSTIDEEASEFSRCLQTAETQAIVAGFLARKKVAD